MIKIPPLEASEIPQIDSNPNLKSIEAGQQPQAFEAEIVDDAEFKRETRKLPRQLPKWESFLQKKEFSAHRFEILTGEQCTSQYLMENGFNEPKIVLEPTGLDLSMPPSNITVRDIVNLAGTVDHEGHYISGKDRVCDVLDVATQSDISMKLSEWQDYFETPAEDRPRILNIISLEIGDTDLGRTIKRPKLARDLDWVDIAWPSERYDAYDYPRVQLYCLMGVGKSYTDFHIDFGGTSVFYHVVSGEKIFYMIPPTKDNLKQYETWSGSSEQSKIFLPEMLRKGECVKVQVRQGNTMFIPSGWIHSVYTTCDSIVIGGNFLHTLAIPMQLKCAQIEIDTNVPTKFRYPAFNCLLFYVARYYLELFSSNDPKIYPKEIENIPLLIEYLLKLLRKQDDITNLSKNERKAYRAEFPRDITNLRNMVETLERKLHNFNFGKKNIVGLSDWIPGLDEMEFLDSEHDLSDHLMIDATDQSSESGHDSSDVEFTPENPRVIKEKKLKKREVSESTTKIKRRKLTKKEPKKNQIKLGQASISSKTVLLKSIIPAGAPPINNLPEIKKNIKKNSSHAKINKAMKQLKK